MAVRIVLDVESDDTLRRIGRGLVAVVGGILVVAGLVVLGVSALMVGLCVSDAANDKPLDTGLVLSTAGSVAAAVVLLLLGVRCVRGRRRLVLFLRRFGLTEVTAAVTMAVVTSIGRSWRLVTLDDSRTAPVGPSRGGRRFSTLTIVVTLLVVGAAVFWLVGGGFDSWAANLDIESSGGSSAEGFSEAVGRAIGEAIVAGLIVGLVLAAVIVVASIAGVGALFGFGTRRAVRRAERSKAVVVADERGVAAVTERYAVASRRVFGSRLVVARVADAVWRQTVISLARASAVVLVDVTSASDNVLWELGTLDENDCPRVLIGQQARLDPLDDRLAEVLDGQEILAYGEGRRALRRFAGALRSRLEQEDR